MEQEDKNRIQDDIGHCADEYGQHGGLGLALRSDEHVKSQRKLHENGSDQIYADIAVRVDNSLVAGPEHIEKWPLYDQKQERQRNGEE